MPTRRHEETADSQQVKRECDRLRRLLEINNAIASKLDPRELFRSVATSISRVVPHDAAALCLYEPERNAVRLVALDVGAKEGTRSWLRYSPVN